MARLPQPGSDNGVWGDLLNDYLGQSLTGSGALKDGIVTDAKIATGVAQSKIQSLVSDLAAKATDASVVHNSLMTTKGDVIAATGSATPARLGVGSNSQVLTADSSQTTGLKWATPVSATVVNVKSAGATGDGTTNDTTAIQAAIDSSSNGDTIFFPAGTYIISAPIRLLPNRSYEGGGTAMTLGAIIKQADSTNMTATGGPVTGLFVADRWFTNNAFCDNPLTIVNICFDGNRANNASSTACGFIGYNFWGRIYNCVFKNMPIDGIRLADQTQSGTMTGSGVGSAWIIVDNWIENVGARGVYAQAGANNHNMDGTLFNNMISQTGTYGIYIDYAAGWYVSYNHLWAIGDSAIVTLKTFSTQVMHNYIEDFGRNKASAAFYQGINMRQGIGRQSICTGNVVSCLEETASPSNPTYQYLNFSSDTSATDAAIISAENRLQSVGSSRALGLVASNQSGGVLRLRMTGNDLNGFGSGRDSFVSSGVIVRTDQNYSVGSGAASPTAAAQAAAGTSAPSPTIGSNTWDNAGLINTGTGSGPTTGTQVTVTFSGAWRRTPFVTITPENAATAALQPYVTSTSTTAFSVGFGVAPAASQAVGTYAFNFSVNGA